MPQFTIYVDQALADAVRRAGIPISSTCQRALARKVKAKAAVERDAREAVRLSDWARPRGHASRKAPL